MRTNITHYSILISCPGDIKADVKTVEKAISKFNNYFSDSLGIYVEAIHWSNGTYAQSGGNPQTLVNEQIVHPSDMAIALFWTRFGSPTNDYDSGTEEEISEMLNCGKQVFLFFSKRKINPDDIDSAQYQQVISFKERYSKTGLYNEYKTHTELEELVLRNLTKHFTTKIIGENTIKLSSSLEISCILNGQLTPGLYCGKFDPSVYRDLSKFLHAIEILVGEINKFELVEKREEEIQTVNASLKSMFIKSAEKVTVDDKDRKLIIEVCGKLGMALADDFFFLGDLKHNALASMSNGPAYYGSEEEKEKYKKINTLSNLVVEYDDIHEYLTSLSNFYYMKLVLRNVGTLVDSNIDIQIRFPSDSVVNPLTADLPDYYCCKRLVQSNGCVKLFSIRKSLLYKEYWDSMLERKLVHYSQPSISLTGTRRDYINDYLADLKNEFPYEFYKEKDNDVVCIHFDSIKHNTNVAFPTVILLQTEVEEISYSITSTNTPVVIKGTLTRGEYNE